MQQQNVKVKYSQFCLPDVTDSEATDRSSLCPTRAIAGGCRGHTPLQGSHHDHHPHPQR